MGGPYNIPRNYKGENKILFIFSMKSFIYTAVGGFIGILFYYLFKMLGIDKIGWIFIIFFALIGFAVGTFKIPDNSNLSFSRKVGGEAIDDVIMRWIKFKRKNNRIYVYKDEIKEESKDVK